MSEDCEHCGEGPPDDPAMNAIMLAEDEFVFGHSFRCPECDIRLNPLEAVEEEPVGEDDGTKFLGNDKLTYGME
jgi:hypothetical protein